MIRTNTNFLSVCLVPTVEVGSGKFATQNFCRCHANCIDGKYHQFRQIASALSAASTNVSDKKFALAGVVGAFDSVFAEIARAQRKALFSVGAAFRGKWQLRCHPLFAFAKCYVGGDLVLLRREIKS